MKRCLQLMRRGVDLGKKSLGKSNGSSVRMEEPERLSRLAEFQEREILERFNVQVGRGGVATTLEEGIDLGKKLKEANKAEQLVVVVQGRTRAEETTVECLTELKSTLEEKWDCTLPTVIKQKLEPISSSKIVIELDRENASLRMTALDINHTIRDQFAMDVMTGPSDEMLSNLALEIGISEHNTEQAARQLSTLYDVFIGSDLTSLWVHSFGEAHYSGTAHELVVSSGVYFDIDWNARFRQKELFSMLADSFWFRDERDRFALFEELKSTPMKGRVGVLSNGAGIGFAAMDSIHLQGGSVGNLIDVSGVCSTERVAKACEMLFQDQALDTVLVLCSFDGVQFMTHSLREFADSCPELVQSRKSLRMVLHLPDGNEPAVGANEEGFRFNIVCQTSSFQEAIAEAVVHKTEKLID